jgi:hypothetical protein
MPDEGRWTIDLVVVEDGVRVSAFTGTAAAAGCVGVEAEPRVDAMLPHKWRQVFSKVGPFAPV